MYQKSLILFVVHVLGSLLFGDVNFSLTYKGGRFYINDHRNSARITTTQNLVALIQIISRTLRCTTFLPLELGASIALFGRTYLLKDDKSIKPCGTCK
jgi:hypothetical protein